MDNPFLTESFESILARSEAGAPTALNQIFGDDDWQTVAQRNRRYYEGDHWQDGEGWAGPLPTSIDRTPTEVTEEVKKIFTPRNVIKEVVDRKVDGLLKRRPKTDYSFIDDENPNEELRAEALDYFNNWMKSRNGYKIVKELYGRSQLGERPVLRMYIPRGLLDQTDDGFSIIPTNLSIADYLDMIHMQVLHTGSAYRVVDRDTQLECIVCETQTTDRHYQELTCLDGKTTVLRVISNGIDSIWRMDMDGMLTMHAPRIQACVTEQVVRGQKALNLTKTMMTKNTIMGGFLERVITDAMPPGQWVTDPNDENREIYQVGRFTMGPGTTNFLMAAEYIDEETDTKRMGNPKVHYKDPVDNRIFIDAIRALYQDILEEVGQPHVLMAGRMTASGTSREKAREIFVGTLTDDESELALALRWMMKSTLGMAAFLAGQAGRYSTLEPDVVCFMSTGVAEGDERQENREDYKSGLLSRQTAMSRAGVDDPAYEIQRITDEQVEAVTTLKDKVTLIATLVQAGADFESACAYIDAHQRSDIVVSAPEMREPEEQEVKDDMMQTYNDDYVPKPPTESNQEGG